MPVNVTSQLVEYTDFALNSSNKVFFVPTDTVWRLVHVWAKLVTTNTVGNRQLDIHILDTLGNRVGTYQAGAVQIASRTQYYSFHEGHPQETAFTPAATGGTMLRVLGKDVRLLDGYALRVWDSAAIAAAADDLSVSIMVEEALEPWRG